MPAEMGDPTSCALKSWTGGSTGAGRGDGETGRRGAYWADPVPGLGGVAVSWDERLNRSLVAEDDVAAARVQREFAEPGVVLALPRVLPDPPQRGLKEHYSA